MHERCEGKRCEGGVVGVKGARRVVSMPTPPPPSCPCTSFLPLLSKHTPLHPCAWRFHPFDGFTTHLGGFTHLRPCTSFLPLLSKSEPLHPCAWRFHPFDGFTTHLGGFTHLRPCTSFLPLLLRASLSILVHGGFTRSRAPMNDSRMVFLYPSNGGCWIGRVPVVPNEA